MLHEPLQQGSKQGDKQPYELQTKGECTKRAQQQKNQNH